MAYKRTAIVNTTALMRKAKPNQAKPTTNAARPTPNAMQGDKRYNAPKATMSKTRISKKK